ncbi:hypothetical protein [Desulfobacter vibrioformis]|uniref:hypothetical protein n=1 Tax=Desulfobacter vibrioformis TaxID=34031 RepID=UPI0005514FBA|nr:hypothetical protein [Desulfobacter vibrioformis]
MKKILIPLLTLMLAALIITGTTFSMEKHETDESEKIGELFHTSTVDGYMLSYYLMDLREQQKKDMDKPHHIMVYIMDKDHQKVLEGKVGFMIKDSDGNTQKAMAMLMGEGFGITADMKKEGIYTITTKAVLGDVNLMDKFTYETK